VRTPSAWKKISAHTNHANPLTFYRVVGDESFSSENLVATKPDTDPGEAEVLLDIAAFYNTTIIF